jgi:hypothetical protein
VGDQQVDDGKKKLAILGSSFLKVKERYQKGIANFSRKLVEKEGI